MSKRSSDTELRNAIVAGLKAALRDFKLTKSDAAQKLGIKRQTLWLYLKGKVTPGGEVLRRAFELWGLKIVLGGYTITKESFGPIVKHQEVARPIEQFSLLDQLENLNSEQLEVEAVGRRGEYFEFKIRIRAGAQTKT